MCAMSEKKTNEGVSEQVDTPNRGEKKRTTGSEIGAWRSRRWGGARPLPGVEF
jgi:hypothetical protein